jgi:hypothetical protein
MKITKQQFLNLNPCTEAVLFAKSVQFNPVIGWNLCKRGDWLIRLLRSTNLLNKRNSVLLAAAFAEHVLPFFELKNPKDFRPRKALEAAKDWLANPSPRTAAAAGDAYYAGAAAAYAAAAAADAAYYAAAAYAAAAAADAAAHAAAAAADAAAAAADAAAYAAAAAAYADAAYAAAAASAAAAAAAAYADAAAAYADAGGRSKEWEWQAEKIRELIKCPFEN